MELSGQEEQEVAVALTVAAEQYDRDADSITGEIDKLYDGEVEAERHPFYAGLDWLRVQYWARAERARQLALRFEDAEVAGRQHTSSCDRDPCSCGGA